MPKPTQGTYPVFFDTYIGQVKENELKAAFLKQQEVVDNFFQQISEEKSGYAYAPGKWTLKELLQHIIDTERIFNYRSLAFARKETASLPGFEEDIYAENSFANERTWNSLVEELKAVRLSTVLLYNSFNTAMLNHSGICNNNPNTVIALGFATVGHLAHHISIIESRYLQVQ